MATFTDLIVDKIEENKKSGNLIHTEDAYRLMFKVRFATIKELTTMLDKLELEKDVLEKITAYIEQMDMEAINSHPTKDFENL